MPGIILGLSTIQARPTDEPLLVSWYDQGTRYGVAVRIPSLRRDSVKLKLIHLDTYRGEELKLSPHPETRDLTNGKFNYEVREPYSDAEIASCLRVVARNREIEELSEED